MDIYSSVMSDGTNITNYSFSFTSNQQFTLSQNNGFFPSGNKITFDACGGTLPSAYDSYIPDNYNTGRGEGELIVYNVPDSVAYTNKYGVEVLAEADGRVSAKREYSSSEQFTVPINGMVISAHFDAAGTAAAFINGVSIGDYVGCDYDNNIVYAYDSIDAYLANHKYVPSGSAYGTLPTPTRSGYIFDGWYTASSDGTEITSDSVYSASKLYAHWKAEDANIPGLKITSQPVDYTGKIGDTAKFTVSANNEHVTYQWQQNTGAGWTNINTTVGRSKTFSIAIAQFRLNYKYRCVVSDGTNIITSDEVKMVVNEEFKITTQPTNFTGKIGDTAKFTVEANGENLTYQWEQDTGNGWTAINTTAGRSKTFSIAIAQFRLGYKYRCVVSNGTDSLTSDEVQMVVAETLAITSQPTNYTGTIGDTAKFIVTATGATSYQWQQNTGAGWANINTSVGRSKTFSLGVTAARANYQYRCVVSDGTTSLTTNAVKMVIDEDLAIVSQPSNYIGAIGSTAKFTVEATGATSYQWYQNTGNGWTAINTTAGRSNTFSIAIAQFRLGYLYRCVVSDGTNEITSDEVQMYIG
ncbi:MAG: InlB B-repeat-containing protein [Oscillospiraceae bacterium]|nr:InlB B-repeat-containing protein [Oscillospiraceae bacterium]